MNRFFTLVSVVDPSSVGHFQGKLLPSNSHQCKKKPLMGLKGTIFNCTFLEEGNSPKILKMMDGGEW